ncbi:hypothetical protein ACFV4F_30635 [Kitasatospora sp. NPDC059722]|uniref:hypothetical protein n=1 Tax=unclassified Kitasatospora TaxID=2633591 RepID=UPI003651C452
MVTIPAGIASSTSEEGPSTALHAAVYGHDRWKNEIGPVVYGLLIPEKSVVTRVTPTPASPLR